MPFCFPTHLHQKWWCSLPQMWTKSQRNRCSRTLCHCKETWLPENALKILTFSIEDLYSITISHIEVVGAIKCCTIIVQTLVQYRENLYHRRVKHIIYSNKYQTGIQPGLSTARIPSRMNNLSQSLKKCEEIFLSKWCCKDTYNLDIPACFGWPRYDGKF